MKIFSAAQSKELDSVTIQKHFSSSLELMEQAVTACFNIISKRFERGTHFSIFCGQGNNGGDGLAIARLLFEADYPVKVFIAKIKDIGSKDFEANLKSLPVETIELTTEKDIPEVENSVIIDALLGSGLNRPLEGLLAKLIAVLNGFDAIKISIDINTGLFAENNESNNLDLVFKSDVTIALDHPKLALCKHTTAHVCENLVVVDIGLDAEEKKKKNSLYYYTEEREVREVYKPRANHTYKNKNGHALLIAGSDDKPGAALLTAIGALRSGVGLLTMQTTDMVKHSLLNKHPEVMYDGLPDYSQFQSIGVGPGLGMDQRATEILDTLLVKSNIPLIIDADAINIIAKNDWFHRIPKGSILTPHPGELKRILGVETLTESYLYNAYALCETHNFNMLIKGKVSALIIPGDGIYFTDFGHPVLARGGSGDLLTGILSALVAQQYTSKDAMMFGVYLHGQAARMSTIRNAAEWLLPEDISDYLSLVWADLSSK